MYKWMASLFLFLSLFLSSCQESSRQEGPDQIEPKQEESSKQVEDAEAQEERIFKSQSGKTINSARELHSSNEERSAALEEQAQELGEE